VKARAKDGHGDTDTRRMLRRWAEASDVKPAAPRRGKRLARRTAGTIMFDLAQQWAAIQLRFELQIAQDRINEPL
jgi:hypothetical protein